MDGKAIDFYERPGYDTFLYRMSQKYEIVVFTAAIEKYASPIIDMIDPNNYISGRLYRQHMKINKDQRFIKDLAIINYDISKIIIVDNMPENFEAQQQNGYLIDDFRGDKMDDKLQILEHFLNKIVENDCEDIRILMGERNKIENQFIQQKQQKQQQNLIESNKESKNFKKGESIEVEEIIDENCIQGSQIESSESIENNNQLSSGKSTPENFFMIQKNINDKEQINNNNLNNLNLSNDIENQIQSINISSDTGKNNYNDQNNNYNKFINKNNSKSNDQNQMVEKNQKESQILNNPKKLQSNSTGSLQFIKINQTSYFNDNNQKYSNNCNQDKQVVENSLQQQTHENEIFQKNNNLQQRPKNKKNNYFLSHSDTTCTQQQKLRLSQVGDGENLTIQKNQNA